MTRRALGTWPKQFNPSCSSSQPGKLFGLGDHGPRHQRMEYCDNLRPVVFFGACQMPSLSVVFVLHDGFNPHATRPDWDYPEMSVVMINLAHPGNVKQYASEAPSSASYQRAFLCTPAVHAMQKKAYVSVAIGRTSVSRETFLVLAILDDAANAACPWSCCRSLVCSAVRISVPKFQSRLAMAAPTAPARRTGEDYLLAIAAEKCQGEAERAGQRVLKDFRTGALGRFALELPARA